ncbi:helicase HerA domain-containing protein [Desulfogranum japonicum]|uniref:helicase HerA domain-containing protein n=1 Tax=Desulfogranum japonicum TaxID=231447 RepID=UPI0003FC16FF|nr:DUF87 domain-containing protein [Desulfogranum japonicum]
MTAGVDYEKMDLFYLGRELDAQGITSAIPFVFNNRELRTHAAILGMTGSGKTGLGITLLEEAAIDGIPCFILDPKGDMGNLLLSTPSLRADTFKPWIDEQQAERQGISRDELARQTAQTWKHGLESWDQSAERIQRMRDRTAFNLFTPGSTRGRPLSLLHNLEAPDLESLQHTDTIAGLVSATASSLLGLLGIQGDPLTSREHILLSTILLTSWKEEKNLSIETVISQVVQPPFEKVGIIPVDSFFPQNKRMDLAVKLNNLLASPTFAAWMQGEELSIEQLLYDKSGKPALSVFSIAHLTDAERMFFVTLFLGRLLTWMRKQKASSGLRCLLYMDEIFGFFPPTSQPPSKKLMLLLLKQARAYGVGVVLSTQNPVDLDYKGLANIGTWFVGRMQTRQDQDRVLSNISRENTQVREAIRNALGTMRRRVFLVHSTYHPDAFLFECRWTISYLKGPLSLDEIAHLNQEKVPVFHQKESRLERNSQEINTAYSANAPLLETGIGQRFVPPPFPGEQIQFRPSFIGFATVRIVKQARGVDRQEQVCLKLEIPGSREAIAWNSAEPVDLQLQDLALQCHEGSRYASLPGYVLRMKNLHAEKKALIDYLYHNKKYQVFQVKSLKIFSDPGEGEQQFRQRIHAVLIETLEEQKKKVQESYLKKRRALETRLEKAQSKLEKEEQDVYVKGVDTVMSIGTAVIGALFGRKLLSTSTANRAARGVRSAGRLAREKADVERAREEILRIQDELQLLTDELQIQIGELTTRFAPEKYPVETVMLTPRRADIFDVDVFLLWEPDFSSATFA